jgi:hypothetical protein
MSARAAHEGADATSEADEPKAIAVVQRAERVLTPGAKQIHESVVREIPEHEDPSR